jgi:5-methylcytosine-specific restriction protein A
VTPADEVDHIVPLELGGSDSDANKQSLCRECHAAKTDREREVRDGVRVA